MEKLGLAVDFDKVWRSQYPSDSFLTALAQAAKEVHDTIIDTPPMVRNVTEWAKNQACWNRVKAIEIGWHEPWLEELLSEEEQQRVSRSGVKDQRVLNGIEAQSAVINAGGQFWSQALSWASSRKVLTPKEAGILEVASGIPRRLPTEKQSLIAIEALRKMHVHGFQLGKNIFDPV